MKRFFQLLSFPLGCHLVALLFMSVHRGAFFLAMSPALQGESASAWPAFLRGLWFDNVVGCYLLFLPLTFCLVIGAVGIYRRWHLKIMSLWMGISYALVFMATVANIPYFDYFSKTLNSSIWQWFAYPEQTAGMLFGEVTWIKYILLYVASVVLFGLFLWFWRKKVEKRLYDHPSPSKNKSGKWQFEVSNLTATLVSVLLIGLCIFGMRGRMGYNPIKVSQAYYCDNTVLNQMGLNAAFCLLQTTLDDQRSENRTLHLMDSNEAVELVKQWLGRDGMVGISPLARQVSLEKKSVEKKNVVVVFMESMSALLMERFGNDNKLTPVLDSLYRNGLSFCNFYSAGNHTNHGLYATLYGFPSIMKRNAMKGSNIPIYSGLPTVMKEQGWQTLFFMTHESQYDNMNAFLRTNGYDEVYAQENYPADKIANHFGVPDDYLFEYALPVLDERAKSGRPFLATLLTISNHPPYIIQPYFHPHTTDPELQIVEYADWSIGKFMNEAAKRPWFDNTIFIFLGDHGKKLGQTQYEVAESFNHIPLIIYGKGINSEERSDFAGQIDLAPTILGYLGVSYVQNNFGIDLTRERRPMIFYSADNVVAARNDSLLYIFNPDANRDFCYDVSRPGEFHPVPFSSAFVPLKQYVFANLQATEYLVQKGLTTNKPSVGE